MKNTYFSHGTHSEKTLYEDLIIEQLKIFGHEVHYLPRTTVTEDKILGEIFKFFFLNFIEITKTIINETTVHKSKE